MGEGQEKTVKIFRGKYISVQVHLSLKRAFVCCLSATTLTRFLKAVCPGNFNEGRSQLGM